MMLVELAHILRTAGLQVVEEPGWQVRGHGGMSGVQTIVCHHTGGLKDLRVVRDGRPGLDGPLAHVWLAQDGVWHLVAAGKCWHAGVVRDPSFANEWAIGIEAEATGTDPWPPIQYHSYAKGCAALVDAFKLTPARVLGHKEVCAPVGRKSDPNFDMDGFRSLVARYLADANQPARPVEEVMATADEVAEAVWRYQVLRRETDDPKDTIAARDALGYASRFGYLGLSNDQAEAARDAADVAELRGRLVSLEQGLNTLTELVRSLAPPQPS